MAKSSKNGKSARTGGFSAATRQTVVLVDGSGYIFRAYHALPSLTRKRDGLPVGAVYGFCNMLQKLIVEIESEGGAGYMAVLFDAGRYTFRNKIYADYKAHRPPLPDDLLPQFSLIREAVLHFNIPSLEKDGFEADDLIASYSRVARAEGYDVMIISSDKDLMQLVGDGVLMRDPLKNRTIGEDEVREKFGVGPDKVVDVQALAGDSSDNVPGVPGIGVKTAAELLNTYGSLDTLLDRAEEIKQPKRRESLIENADLARISRELVRLRDNVPLNGGIEALAVNAPDPEQLFPWLEEMGFNSLLNRLRARWIGGQMPTDLSGDQHTGAAEYGVIFNRAELDQVISEIQETGIAALHLEATESDETASELNGVGIATAPGRAWYLPLAQAGEGLLQFGETASDTTALTAADFSEALRILADDRGVLLVAHDAKRLINLLSVLGVEVSAVEDTLLLSFVLGGGRDSHALEDVVQRVVGVAAPVRKDLLGVGNSSIAFVDAKREVAIKLTAGNADVVLRTRASLRAELFHEHLVSVYETIERPLAPVLGAMERNGVRINSEALATLSEDFAAVMEKSECAARDLAGREFNIGSPKQVGEILFDEMGLSGGRKTRTGAWSTDADTLESLAATGNKFAEVVLNWRLVAKLRSTYTETLAREINDSTGRVHTTYGMAGAATGRLASVNPNLQNIPVRTEEGRRIRRAFISDPGNVLVSADYSQIELRLLAHMANIDSLKRAFRDGVDIHALTASEIFDVPIKGMDAETRRRAKAINFGIIYGISPFGLARQLDISQGQAKQYIEAYFERYPGIRDYMERAKQFARKKGYVTTWFGRRVHIPGIGEKNHNRRSFSERAAINAPLQGSAADIMKRAMIRVHRALGRSSLDARMLLSVHDELLFEVPENQAEELAALAKREMEGAGHAHVPLTIDTGVGRNWDEAH